MNDFIYLPVCLSIYLELNFFYLPGALQVFPGGPLQAAEEVLCEERELSHPHIPGDLPQRRQLRGPCAEDPEVLGAGDRRGPVPGRSPQRAPAAEDQATHLL